MQITRTFRQPSKCFCYFFDKHFINYNGEIMNKLKILCIPGWNEGCSVFDKIKEDLKEVIFELYREI